MIDVKITDLTGETISSIEVIKAEPGRTNPTYLLLTTESGKRAVQGILGVTQKTVTEKGGPDPTVSEMLKAPEFFNDEDIAAKAERDARKEADRSLNKRKHDEKEYLRLKGVLGL